MTLHGYVLSLEAPISPTSRSHWPKRRDLERIRFRSMNLKLIDATLSSNNALNSTMHKGI